MESLIRQLREGGYSCVVRNGNETRTFCQRGVADLLEMYDNTPVFLRNSQIADKVVGKGAAALMVLGGVNKAHADVISSPALQLLRTYGVDVTYSCETDRIMNRHKDGLCPVESLCLDLDSPEEMLTEIRNFIKYISNGKNC